MKQRRLMIAAPKSGSGKTIITCGLLELLKREGRDVIAFKCGPDYIDPMFHRTVTEVPASNLDTFFSSPDEIRRKTVSSGHDTAVIEGVMGIYDGITGTFREGSCYEVASVTDTPVLLVIDVSGMGATMMSVIRGILADDCNYLIRGIVLNRISGHYYSQTAPVIRSMLREISDSRGTEVRLVGGLPVSEDIDLKSRHLGLMMPSETADLRDRISAAARLISEYLDMDAVMDIMEGAGELSYGSEDPEDLIPVSEPSHPVNVTLAVARDEAFCFYYEENIRLLKSYGIRITEFSPLHDCHIPDDADGILLGGGYPELYAEQLSGNVHMMTSIREAVASGMPSFAECGGFMTLLGSMESGGGRSYPMAGVITGSSHNTGKLSRFGYITVSGREDRDSILSGLHIRGHEFHYWDSDANGDDAAAVKPGSGRSWNCIHAGKDHIWGYPHLYYPSCPELVLRMRDAMTDYHMRCSSKEGPENDG